ncbi:hypothetical protein ACVWY3_001601 [Bradyrhizobium sp. USDA 4486]
MTPGRRAMVLGLERSREVRRFRVSARELSFRTVRQKVSRLGSGGQLKGQDSLRQTRAALAVSGLRTTHVDGAPLFLNKKYRAGGPLPRSALPWLARQVEVSRRFPERKIHRLKMTLSC